MVIASQALTALVPLLLLISSLAPADRRDVVSRALIRRFELSGDAADAVREVFARPVGTSSIGLLSVVILLFSGVSLARRIQRMYRDAWRLEAVPGVRDSLNSSWPWARCSCRSRCSTWHAHCCGRCRWTTSSAFRCRS